MADNSGDTSVGRDVARRVSTRRLQAENATIPTRNTMEHHRFMSAKIRKKDAKIPFEMFRVCLYSDVAYSFTSPPA
jgi:hypothetical protein